MNYYLEIVSGLVGFIGLFLILRNWLVHKLNDRAIDFIFDQYNWVTLIKRFNEASYDAKVLDLRKWTYKQFYPYLAELERRSGIQSHKR